MEEHSFSQAKPPTGGRINHFVLEARVYIELDGPGTFADAVRRAEEKLSAVMQPDVYSAGAGGPKVSVIRIEEIRTRKA